MINSAASPDRNYMDQYFTPPWATNILDFGSRITNDTGGLANILEPCTGVGHIAKFFRDKGHSVTTVELDPSLEDQSLTKIDYSGCDFLKMSPKDFETRFDWVITNPPYTLKEKKSDGGYRITHRASDFFRHAKSFAPNVAMLLRLGWLELCSDREDLLQDLTDIIITPRINFEGSKSNNSSPSVWCIYRESDKYDRLSQDPLVSWGDPYLTSQWKKDWETNGWDAEFLKEA